MFKRVLLAVAVAAAVSAPAFAEVSINGSAEMDLMYATNNDTGAGSTGGKFYNETAIVINFNGSEKLDSGMTLGWKVAQKVATGENYARHDALGKREAYVSVAGDWGSVRAGNQFTNSYLTLDWPYGVNGSGRTTADFGTFSGWFADSVSYFSPAFGPFSFTAQYSFGNKGSVNGKDVNTNAADLGANLNFGVANIDVGYQTNKDVLLDPTWTDTNYARFGSKANIAGVDSNMYFVGARGNVGDFGLRALYKRNEVTGLSNLAGGTNNEHVDQWLVGGSYAFGKNSITASFDSIGNFAGVDNTGVKTVAAQYNYSVSKNAVAFVQVRHHMYDDNAAVHFDGGSASKDSNTRLTIGTWAGF